MILLTALYLAAPLAIGIALGLMQVKPPLADESSAAFARMMRNIERMATEPRVVGTRELDRARALIVAEVEGMGLRAEIQSTPYTREEAIEAWLQRITDDEVAFAELVEQVSDGRIKTRFADLPDSFFAHNIFVRLESPGASNTILFASHYDSWPESPGAVDAMTPVAAMLEAMRDHAGNDALANNIYFIITDGEEFAALGVRAFIAAHPELRDKIDMIVNLDSQGTRGALILFETSPAAHSMLNVFRRAAPSPLAFSVGKPAYDALRTYTDFSFFLRDGWRGINLAVIEGGEYYHTSADTLRHLDRNTAWHYLTTVTGIADYAARNSLESLRGPSVNAVFFPLLPGNMALFSYAWAYALCALAVTLSIAYFFFQKRKKRRPTFFSIYLLALSALAIAAAVFLHEGSYLIWLPLLTLAITAFLKRWKIAHRVAQATSRVLALLLWVPLVYLIATLLFVPTTLALAALCAVYLLLCLTESPAKRGLLSRARRIVK